MTTMTNKEVLQASERVTERGITEVPPEEPHKAIPAPRKMPAYQGDAKATRMPAYQGEAKAPLSRRPFVVGVVAGALGLALGAGAVFWASSAVTEREPIPYSGILYLSGGGGSSGVTDGGAYAYPPTP